MNRWILAGVLLASLPIQAQKHHRSTHERPGHAMNAEQRATLKSKEMALMLDLETSQQNQVQETLAAHFEAREAMRESLRRDGAAKEQNRFAMRNARLDQQLALQAEMKRILEEEQYNRWKKARMQRHKRMARRGRYMHRQTKL